MMKGKRILLTLFLISSLVSLGEETEKKWSLKTGISHKERQQGRMTGRAYDKYDAAADDLNEDGDVTSIYTGLGYRFNDKWSFEYKYSYDYINNNERFGKYRADDGSIKNSDKDTGQYIDHQFKLTRKFEKFDLLGKEWDSSVWLAYKRYRESSIQAEGEYLYNGFWADRVYFNANMNTSLTEKTHLDLNFTYQYRPFDYDNSDKPHDHQHRQYYSVTVDHDFTENLYFSFGNTLEVRQYAPSSRNRDSGRWNYHYTLGHNYHLNNGYLINTELTAWAELGIWEKGGRGQMSNNQAEINFMPKLKKTYELSEDLKISGFIGAGYVYGYDTRTGRKTYQGFEGRGGVEASYDF
jgi:hypothetical protein